VLGDSCLGRSDHAPPSSPPSHRRSSDVSVDNAIGKAILKHKLSEFTLLTDEERCMLTWNLKNVEYALGANLKDLSMKFWDIDERHAFEGDHVLLRQGYSSVVDHLHRLLKERGDHFSHCLSFPVGKLEYNRKTSTQPYVSIQPRNRKFVELSDTCCVTSQDNSRRINCDFVVSAVPLGVLKASTQGDSQKSNIAFRPPLPFVKRDAIDSVGFGLLNKAYLQFPFAFWTSEEILGMDRTQFGNASGINPHHYMFVDIGRTLGPAKGSPAILMSLISGSEAAACEQMTQEAVVGEIMETLRTLFSDNVVPDPIAFKVTRWGSDQFSRGSYTFLTPGTTDEDLETLQSPVNGNGDSLLLEGSETMRLFFAGEHTTALHPSMAHGAMGK
jgi:lysine-specific histone demethylase 1